MYVLYVDEYMCVCVYIYIYIYSDLYIYKSEYPVLQENNYTKLSDRDFKLQFFYSDAKI